MEHVPDGSVNVRSAHLEAGSAKHPQRTFMKYMLVLFFAAQLRARSFACLLRAKMGAHPGAQPRTADRELVCACALETLRIRTKMLCPENFMSGSRNARSAFQWQIALKTLRIRTKSLCQQVTSPLHASGNNPTKRFLAVKTTQNLVNPDRKKSRPK